MNQVDPDEVEIYATFVVSYPARCRINWDHRIKMGEKAGKLQYKKNPMIPIAGSACQSCMKEISKAKK